MTTPTSCYREHALLVQNVKERGDGSYDSVDCDLHHGTRFYAARNYRGQMRSWHAPADTKTARDAFMAGPGWQWFMRGVDD